MAPHAEARLMARLVTPPEEFVQLLRSWVGDRADLEIGITVELARLGTLAGFPTSIAAYATDIPKLSNWGKPYLFGPGSIQFAHRDDEHILVSELRSAVDAYVKIAVAALDRSG
jgi:acetylornithine deacetylase